MEVKPLLVSGLVTLVVTVTAGFVVYKLTAGSVQPRAERLQMQIDEPVGFEGEKSSLSIQRLALRNTGTAPASDVTLSVHVPGPGKLAQRIVRGAPGANLGYKLENESQGGFDIRIAKFLPAEEMTATWVVEGAARSRADVSGRSNETLVARVASFAPEIARSSPGPVLGVVFALGPVAALFSGLATRYIRKRIGSLDIENPRNDTAFLLLHQGQISRAAELLSGSVLRDGGDFYELSNYGLCLALLGSEEESRMYLRAAEFVATTDYRRALLHIGRSAIARQSRDDSKAVIELSEAKRLGGKPIAKIAEYSTILPPSGKIKGPEPR